MTPETLTIANYLGLITSGYKGKVQNLPDGWSFVQNSNQTHDSQNGYFGLSIVNNTTKELVFVHNGTDSLRDAWSDFQIYRGNVPNQYNNALNFVNTIEKDYEGYKITHTGHSLGAVLSELLAASQGASAITFDSPGSEPMVRQILHLEKSDPLPELDITTYNTAPTFFNNLHSHVGEVHQISSPENIEKSTHFFGMHIPGLSTIYEFTYVHHFSAFTKNLDKTTGSFITDNPWVEPSAESNNKPLTEASKDVKVDIVQKIQPGFAIFNAAEEEISYESILLSKETPSFDFNDQYYSSGINPVEGSNIDTGIQEVSFYNNFDFSAQIDFYEIGIIVAALRSQLDILDLAFMG